MMGFCRCRIGRRERGRVRGREGGCAEEETVTRLVVKKGVACCGRFDGGDGGGDGAQCPCGSVAHD